MNKKVKGKLPKKTELLNQVCFWLIKLCQETDAETMKITQENVTVNKKSIGNWEIKVKKIK